jgi:hypothetical protein
VLFKRKERQQAAVDFSETGAISLSHFSLQNFLQAIRTVHIITSEFKYVCVLPSFQLALEPTATA